MIGGTESGAGETGFRARTATITLMFALGSNREDILELLETALLGGLLEPHAEEEIEGEDYEYEEEIDDESLLQLLPPALREPRAAIGPYSKTRASPKGIQFLFVVSALERWLSNCPAGPVDLTEDAGSAVATLVCSWSATVAHALAALPLTMSELHRTVGILDYETAEEHVRAMERDDLVEVHPSAGETRYSLSAWARQGIAPIIAAARYEAHFPEVDVAPPDILDVEAAFQMALPAVLLPPRFARVLPPGGTNTRQRAADRGRHGRGRARTGALIVCPA